MLSNLLIPFGNALLTKLVAPFGPTVVATYGIGNRVVEVPAPKSFYNLFERIKLNGRHPLIQFAGIDRTRQRGQDLSHDLRLAACIIGIKEPRRGVHHKDPLRVHYGTHRVHCPDFIVLRAVRKRVVLVQLTVSKPQKGHMLYFF